MHANYFGQTRSKTKAAKEHFRFLDLPPELRNQIYRLVLVTKNVTKCEPNLAFHDSTYESQPMLYSYPEVSYLTGTVRTHSILKYTLGFQLQLLRVNRQIYEEASSIFKGENGWVIVDVNKTGFGQDLEDHGYAVIYRTPHGRKTIEHPVLRISITFIGPDTAGGSDTFILSTAGINQLPRALWTLQHRSLMKIFYESSPDHTNHPAAARKVVRALSRLWTHSVLRRNLPPAGGCAHLPNWLPEGPPENGDVIALELSHARRVIQQYRRDGNARKAMHLCEKSMAYLADCYLLYGRHVNTGIATTRTIAVRIVSIAIPLAEIQMALRNYAAVIKHCTYVLRLGMTSFNTATSPPPMLLALTPQTKARICMMRAHAYVHLGRRRDAWMDYQVALGLASEDEKGVVQRLGEAMFGPRAQKRTSAGVDQGENVQALKRLRISDSEGGKEIKTEEDA